MNQKGTIDHSALIGQGVIIRGDVTIGKDVSVWYNAVIRGDLAPITIGDRSNVQECSVLHVDHDAPIVLGQGVTVGHGVVLHGCSIGDNSLIGMGATILNNANIGKNCIIGAGALVTQGMVVPDNSLVMGMPAKIKRSLTEQEITQNRENAEEYVTLMKSEKE